MNNNRRKIGIGIAVCACVLLIGAGLYLTRNNKQETQESPDSAFVPDLDPDASTIGVTLWQSAIASIAVCSLAEKECLEIHLSQTERRTRGEALEPSQFACIGTGNVLRDFFETVRSE